MLHPAFPTLTRALTLAAALLALAVASGTAQAAFIVGNVTGCASTTALCPAGNAFTVTNATLSDPDGPNPVPDPGPEFTSGSTEFTPGFSADFKNESGTPFTTLMLSITPPGLFFAGTVSWLFDSLDIVEPDQVLRDVIIVSNLGFSILDGPMLTGIGTTSGALSLSTGGPFTSSSTLTLQIRTEADPSTPVPVPAPLALLTGGLFLLPLSRRMRH